VPPEYFNHACGSIVEIKDPETLRGYAEVAGKPTMFCVRLMIVDDHNFFRRSLMLPLENEPSIDIVGTATSGDEAVTLARSLRPDVILMDLNMRSLSGLAATERIMQRDHAPAILVLTGVDDVQSVRDALAAGACGYLRKDMITDELLVSAIFTAASGGIFFDDKTFSLLKTPLLSPPPLAAGPARQIAQLSPTERDLLRYVALGYENDDIARALDVSSKTIANRLSQLYLRLEVSNRVRAATLALRSGLVSLNETEN
jgi:DNA-binding NarL/FixJ family response regulator